MLEVRTLAQHELTRELPRLAEYALGQGIAALGQHPGWLTVLRCGLRHEVFCLEATEGGRTVGLLPLACLRSLLFGRFLISLPYLNLGGVLASRPEAAAALVDRAVQLADELDVRYLELRHEAPLEHPALGARMTSKVHMRLDLPDSADELWKRFSPKVRNQIRKGQNGNLTVDWGGRELLEAFYGVFAHNMRDLGTPVFSRRLFGSILEQFPDQAELCVVRSGARPIAGAVLLHGPARSEVPSASSLRRYNSTNANMLMYWNLLSRSIQRNRRQFDFGRSTIDSNTYRFKSQWGASPCPATWQYYLRSGSIQDMRPESSRYRLMIRAWQHLPVSLTRLIGPAIVRGVPA